MPKYGKIDNHKLREIRLDQEIRQGMRLEDKRDQKDKNNPRKGQKIKASFIKDVIWPNLLQISIFMIIISYLIYAILS